MAIPNWRLSKIDSPIDFSFMDFETPEDAIAETPRLRIAKSGKKPEVPRRQWTRALRLNNNVISELTGMSKLVSFYFTSPLKVLWLDLSFNHMFKIPQELNFLKELRILYLHGNRITQFLEIEPLSRLENLWKLTLHGNPVECEKNYRHTVLTIVSTLKNLDFSDVTPSDKFLANNLREFRERRRSKRYSM